MDFQNSPVIKAFVAGSCSGTCSALLFQPLDLVKTRLQTAVAAPAGISNGVRGAGILNVMGNIVHNEQVFGLWKGVTPSIVRCVPGVGIYFATLHSLKTKFTNGNPSPLEAVCLGVVARSFSGLCLIPVTVVKTRVESGVYEYRSMSQALLGIYKHEGVRGLTCGLIPTLLRDAPFSGIYLMFYTQARKNIPLELSQSDRLPLAHFACGLFAGALASVLTQPADVLKTKMQLYPEKFPNLQSVAVHVYDKYGVQGYFKGLTPRLLRRTLMAAMAWTVYEQGRMAVSYINYHITDHNGAFIAEIPQSNPNCNLTRENPCR